MRMARAPSGDTMAQPVCSPLRTGTTEAPGARLPTETARSIGRGAAVCAEGWGWGGDVRCKCEET